ncbi:MAG: hypothetical protein M1497_02110 [Nitrospirae bacterium]|nr:hypothetical protein [Nitrospirota bacterium]
MKTHQTSITALFLLLTLFLWGCYESPFPLGPVETGTINPALTGAWRCIQSDQREEKALLITVLPFDEKQYYAEIAMEAEPPVHYRAYSSRIKGATLLNVQELDAQAAPSARKWVFVRSTLLKQNILQVQIVREDAFKGIEPSPSSVREVVEQKIASPELYQDFCVCTKVSEKK